MSNLQLPQLKACPFCGAAAEMDTRRGYSQYPSGKPGTAVAIYCSACFADMILCREDYPGEETEFLAETLAGFWNARHEDLSNDV